VAEPKIPVKRGRKKKVAVSTPIETAPVPAPKPEKKTKTARKVKAAKKEVKKPSVEKHRIEEMAASLKL